MLFAVRCSLFAFAFVSCYGSKQIDAPGTD